MENIVLNAIIVFVAIVGFLAFMACVGFYRGWFRLASTPPGTKDPFILMRKKDKTPKDDE